MHLSTKQQLKPTTCHFLYFAHEHDFYKKTYKQELICVRGALIFIQRTLSMCVRGSDIKIVF